MGGTTSKQDLSHAGSVDASSGTRYSLLDLHVPTMVSTSALCVVVVVIVVVILTCCARCCLSNARRYRRLQQETAMSNQMQAMEAAARHQQAARLLNQSGSAAEPTPSIQAPKATSNFPALVLEG